MDSMITEPRLSHTDVERRLELAVTGKDIAADGVVLVTLAARDGSDLPAWTPGAHVELVLSDGLVRQYSLCGDPGVLDSYQVAVLRERDSRGGSRYVHDRLAVGDSLIAHGPRNHFALHEAERYLFVAGGIGITPLIPMMAWVAARGRPFRLTYGGRTRSSMAFADDLRNRYPDSVELVPQDEAGVIDLDAAIGAHHDGLAVYTCGPSPLLDAVEKHCADWPSGTLRMERFRPAELPSDAVDKPFEVELAQTGITVSVPAGRSILDVAEEAGVSVLSSCREGTCGTCETRIVEGIAEHRDSLLTDEEKEANETMFICVSRSRSARLVLDL